MVDLVAEQISIRGWGICDTKISSIGFLQETLFVKALLVMQQSKFVDVETSGAIRRGVQCLLFCRCFEGYCQAESGYV